MFQASMFCNRQSLCDSCKFRSRSNILSIYLSINLSIYLYIHLSIYPSIHPSIYLLASLHFWRWNRSILPFGRLEASSQLICTGLAQRCRQPFPPLAQRQDLGWFEAVVLGRVLLALGFGTELVRVLFLRPRPAKAAWRPWEIPWKWRLFDGKKMEKIMEIMGTIINRWIILWSLSENGGIPPNSQI